MAQLSKRNFTAGELAPSLRSRTDIAKYTNGLALCENFFVRAQGGVYSRPGTRFVGELKDSDTTGRLIPFSFNTEQTYILVFQDLTMRVIKDGGYVLETGQAVTAATQANPCELTITGHGYSTGDEVDLSTFVGMTELNGRTVTITVTGANTFTLDGIDSTAFGAYVSGGLSERIYTLATTYTEAELPRLGFTQSADVMTIVHPNHDPADLSRLAEDNWTLVDKDYTPSIAAPATLAGVAVGTASGAPTKGYRYVVTAVSDTGDESLPSPSKTITLEALSVTYGVQLTWPAVTGAVKYRAYKEVSLNSGVYGWIGDATTLEFRDYNIAPVSSDSPPEDRTPFNGADNKPAAVDYYQQRQVLANTTNEPQTVYTTQTALFNSLRTSNPAADDDAVTFTIAGRQVNEIRHIIALNSLILLTSGGGWLVTEGQDEVLTPSTVGVRIQTYVGAAWTRPAVVEDTVVYVQEKGSKLRDLNYEFANDKYQGNDLSIMSEHLFEGFQITEMTYAAEPYGVLWCIRDDGVLLGMTYQREHQVVGWHQHTTQGTFESVASITEGDRDAVYMIVKRTINGVTRRFVERMEPRLFATSADSFCVDAGLSYDGSPVTSVSGLFHLESETVDVLADGVYVKDLVVTDGAITLPRAASKIHVGLGYTPAIELLDIDTGEAIDPVKAREISVSKVIMEVEQSRGGFVGPVNDDGSTGTMLEIKPRFESDGYDPLPLKTFKQEIYIDPQWTKGGGIRIEQRAPLPLTILSVIPRIDVGG